MKFVSMFAAVAMTGVRAEERAQAYVSLDGLSDNKGNLQVGDSTDVTVTVKENRTTGYSWEITNNTCGSKF